MDPRYPVYIISKGRSDTRLTSKALEAIAVPYQIVVEPQELAAYASVIARDKILVLPFSDLGLGSIPARNWVWDHARETGADRHWILDDNLDGFYRFNRNLKTPVASGTIFRVAEDFVDRYENVAMAAFNYFMFVSRKAFLPPLTLNTRCYSCILLSNRVDYLWRGRYNEDTDLSLRILKDGHCTVLFNAFLCLKQTTMTMAGGNSDELYAGDGRLAMAESLVEQHPDVAVVSWKFNRHQHHVDYSSFKTRLKLRPDVEITPGVDDFGMVLQTDRSGSWVTIPTADLAPSREKVPT